MTWQGKSRITSAVASGLKALVAVLAIVLFAAACTGGTTVEPDESTSGSGSADAPAEGNETPDAPADPAPPAPTEAAAPEPEVSEPDSAAEPDVVVVGAEVGDCFEDETLAAQVDCTTPHLAQVYASFELLQASDAAFPGDDQLFESASESCVDTLDNALGVAYEFTLLEPFVHYPIEDTWQDGDRTVTCTALFVEPVAERLADVNPARYAGFVSTYDLQAGTCISNESLFDSDFYTLVDCASAHTYEAIANDLADNNEWIGDDEIFEQSNTWCAEQFESLIGEPVADSDWTLDVLHPTQVSWDLGDRTVSCLVSQGGSTSGTAIGSGT